MYEGNGGTQTVTGTGFSPDFVWIKNRDNADDHYLYDTVRGPKNFLGSNTTTAEDYSANDLISFDSDGFTVGSDGGLNRSGQSIVAWCWDAGANNTITGHSSVTYEGSGSAQDIQSLPFTPDLVWIKSSSSSSGNHHLHDSVRGQRERLIANATDAEGTNSSLETFLKNGFRVTGSGNTYNATGVEYVAWCWDAGDSDPASNSNGSITSNVKASTTNGFSIISYTGTGSSATIGHGLSAAPDFFIVKNRDDGDSSGSASANWLVSHSSLSTNQWLKLETTDSVFTNADAFGGSPSSTTIQLGTFNSTNGSSDKMICYAWHDVTGKQKFGKYTGNASSTGPSVTLGFRPGLVMIKGLDRSSVWYVFDTSRTPFNDSTNYTHQYLLWNSSNAEYTTGDDGKIEITSTGFQVRASVTGMNASGEEYIYAAWAGSYSDFITDVNTDGTITSRVKASDTTGHSIVSYTGNGSNNSTVGHGLSSVPDWVITKSRTSGSDNWSVWHSGLTSIQYYLSLNATTAETSGSDRFGTNDPTTSVMNLGYAGSTNSNGANYIMYCWTETTGVSKFGSYTGNGSATGPSITCGFAPAVIFLKRKDSGGSWTISDNTRDTTNPVTPFLFPHGSDVEATDGSNDIDFNSNGFQIKHDSRNNTNSATYIYMAFADTREAAFWLDSSSNNNDWQHVNIDHNDSVSDSPTDNFAVLNPLESVGVLSDGNLRYVSTQDPVTSTIGISSGAFFAEVTVVSMDQSFIGICDISVGLNPNRGGGWTSHGAIAYKHTGDQYSLPVGGSSATTSYGLSYTAGDVIGVAVDVDADTVIFFKNGASQGTTSNGVSHISSGGVYGLLLYGNAGTFEANFGQQPFVYGPPS